jgi:chemotaxis protein MotA
VQVLAGILFVLLTVFGGYIVAGGKMGVILHALPCELLIIGGAVVGSFMISNPGAVCKKTLRDLKKAFKGPDWKRKDYIDLLTLMFEITKTIKQKGLLAIEAHIENAEESAIFKKYPHILHDHHVTSMICDTLRLITMSFEDPYQVDDMMSAELEKHHHEASAPSRAIVTAADGLPAIGIVAAVLGIIKTMASIDQPPIVLGAMIGSALVGTFLGVFLSYCFVGPLGQKLGAIYDEEGQFYRIIKDIINAHLRGNAPQISIEIARRNIPHHLQPTFYDLEAAINAQKEAEGASAAAPSA